MEPCYLRQRVEKARGLLLSARDWLQIRTELGEATPGERKRRQAPETDPDPRVVSPSTAEDSMLQHIAEALRLDEADAD